MINAQKILINSQDYLHFLDKNDIVYCKSDDCYTIAFLQNGLCITISKSLNKFFDQLADPRFVRVSQSFVVNRNKIQSVNKKKKLIEMANNIEIQFTMPIRKLIENLSIPLIGMT